MADVNRGNRPLSPHLQVYRLPMSATTSIFIRITGVGLALSFALIVCWLFAAATGPKAFAHVSGLLTSWFGVAILICSLWGLFYHLLGGLRHLVFDLGYGLSIKSANLMGWIMVVGSFVLTLLTLLALGVFA